MTGIDTVEKNSGFNSILGFGNQAFTVIILLLVAGISAHISYGYSTKRARELFIALILILIVGCQFYHLIFAALYVPATQFHIFNVYRYNYSIYNTYTYSYFKTIYHINIYIHLYHSYNHNNNYYYII